MKISYIECKNIKSFKSLTAELRDFNVIIGLNGSGKSNFILVFKLIKDILAASLEEAVNNQGGITQLINYFSQNGDAVIGIKFQLQTFSELFFTKEINSKEYRARITEISSDFEFKQDANEGIAILKDVLKISLEYFDNSIKLGGSELIVSRNSDKYDFELRNYDSIDYNMNELYPEFDKFRENKYSDNELILHKLFSDVFGININHSAAKQISIYEFEQDLLSSVKSNSLVKEERESRDQFMEILHNVLNDEDKRRQFFNLMNYVLPDIEDVMLEPNADADHKIMVKELYHKRYIPANLLSDGTVFLMIIILSLYFDNKFLTIFDEPERTIHPNIISKVVDMMKDVSTFKQIILSTHNAEIVKYSGIDNIILISRDREGYSQISKPKHSIDITTFLDNDIGLDELFVQNML